MMSRYPAVIIALLLLALALRGQDYQHYTTSDGLSGTDVTAICESENYLWIATNDGLNRFDGNRFTVFKKDNATTNSLSENNIESLLVDSRGLLWIGLKTGGVDVYNPRKNSFRHISKFTATYPQRVVAMFEDSRHHIWLGSWGEGVFQLIPAGDTYTVRQHYDGYVVSTILEKPRGKLWIGTYYGVAIYDMATAAWRQAKTAYAITQFLDAKDEQALWFSAWDKGLYKLRWDDAFNLTEHRYVDNRSGDIYRMHALADGRLLLGTWGNGVNTFDPTASRMSPLRHFGQAMPPVALSLFRDRYSNLWVGTYGNGLYRVPLGDRGIAASPPIGTHRHSAAYTLHPWTANKLLVGTQGDGLYVYDIEERRFSPRQLRGTKTIFDRYILSIYADDHLLIVGNDDHGIHYASFDEKPDDFSLRPYYAGKHLTKATAIFKDNGGRFWIGTKQNGLVSLRWDSVRRTFVDYRHHEGFGSDEITGFAALSDDSLWVSSHSGIYLFDTKHQTVLKQGEANAKEMVYSLVHDRERSCLWLGTSVGLRQLCYRQRPMAIDDAFPHENLPIGAVKDLVLDESDNLWFSIADRMFCYLRGGAQLIELNLDSWGGEPLSSSAKVRVAGGSRLVFGGLSKLLLIDPEVALRQSNPGRILFTELQVDHRKVHVGDTLYGRVVLASETEYTPSIALSYRCKWISLSFTESGWHPYKNRYRYKIFGFSEDWQPLDLAKPLTFSQLPPGDFTLEIRRWDNPDEARQAADYRLQIAIIPPWWQTTGFRVATALLLALLSAFALARIRGYYRKRQLSRLRAIEKRKKEELLQEKENFFTGLSHDLMTPFSLIIAPTKDLLQEQNLTEDQHEKLRIISKNATFLSDIFSAILDYKRIELSDVQEKPTETTVEAVGLMAMIVQVFDYHAKSKGIELTFHCDVQALTISTDAVKLERIAYNLISNALKYTDEGGQIRVSLSYDGDAQFQLSVQDTGQGIPARNLDRVFGKFYQAHGRSTPEGLGLGLYIVHQFVTAMGGTVAVDSEEGRGTRFDVRLPAKPGEVPTDERTDDEPAFSLLLVEDNSQLRDYLEKKLSTHFDIATTSNGREALDFIEANYPEMVISDVVMPEMDGLQLCAAIKQKPTHADIFVILLSARSSPEDELRGYKAGADCYIKKPFDPEVLLHQVRNLQSTRQQRRKQLMEQLLAVDREDELASSDQFLQRALLAVQAHLADERFKVSDLAHEMNLSKTVLHRKFKALIGDTPNVFIRNVRIQSAAKLLKTSELSVAEIAYTTGFSQSHYFIKCFKEVYGVTPKQFRMG